MATFQAAQLPSPFLESNELLNLQQLRQAPQIAEDAHQNALLQRQVHQQTLGTNEIEYAARAAQGLLGLGDEAAMAAAYPGAVASAQQHGFLKNAPSVFPGKARLEQIAAMAIPAEKQYEQQGVAGDYQTWLRSRGGGGTQGTVTPGAVPAMAPGGGFTGDREKDRALIVKQESGGDPTVLNYVARQDPTAYARGATASGKYQFVNSTWREGLQLAGLDPAQYPEARQAPEAVQDKVFDAVYGKYGTKPWEKGAKDWVRDEHGNYQIATVRPPAGSPGGAPAASGTPPPVQVASIPPRVATDATVAPPGAVAPAAAPGAPVTSPGAAPAATPPAPVANIPPPPPRLQNGLTADQDKTIRDLEAIRPRNRAEFDQQQKLIATTEQTYRQHNETVDRQYQSDVRQARLDAQTQQQHAQTQANTDATLEFKRREDQRQQDEAVRAVDKAKRDKKFTGAPTGYQWNDEGTELVRSPGFQGAEKDERLDYRLDHGDPDSAQYAADYAAKKWQMSNAGNVIENDMSMYRPPAQPVQRPTYLPQPSATALEDVRKVTLDADTTVQSIDNYLKVLGETDGATLGAFLNNPRDPKAQKLLGAFDAMKMAMRGPSAMNTGVLQPAEFTMLKEDLTSPQTVRGLTGTTEAAGARLGQIKLTLLRKADAELRSVGKDGILVRTEKEFNALPSGTTFYDKNGNRRTKE